jgi:hypothetical protein
MSPELTMRRTSPDDDVLEASAEPRTRPLAGPRLLDQSKGDLADPDL